MMRISFDLYWGRLKAQTEYKPTTWIHNSSSVQPPHFSCYCISQRWSTWEWVTWPECRKATRTKSRGPKSLQLEVGARRAPRILVDICGSSVMALVALPWLCGGPCTALVGPLSTLKMCIALTSCGGGPSSFLWWPYSCPTMLVQGDFFTGTP